MDEKNPKKVRAGKVGAVRRWGPPRVVRLDDLTPAQRTLVLALVNALRETEDLGIAKRLSEKAAERLERKENS